MAHPFDDLRLFEDLARCGVRGTTFLKPLAPPPAPRATARTTDRVPTVRSGARQVAHSDPHSPHSHTAHPRHSGSARRRGPGGYEGGYTLYTRDIRCKICPTLRVHLIHRSSSPHSTVNTYGFGPSSRKRVWGVTSKPRPHRTAGSIPRCTTGR